MRAYTSPLKLANTFKTVKGKTISEKTVACYLRYMEDSFLVAKAARWNVKGRSCSEIASRLGSEANVAVASGAQGSITMAVGVDSDGKCAGISIIKHSETSGLGEVAASASSRGVSFRESFIGKDESITVHDIDAITGATITSTAITGAVATAIEAVKALG